MSIPTQFNPLGAKDWIPKGYVLVESLKFNGNTAVDTGYLPASTDDFLMLGELKELVAGHNNVVIGTTGRSFEGMIIIYCHPYDNRTIYGGMAQEYDKLYATNTYEPSLFQISKEGCFYNGFRICSPYNVSSKKNWIIGSAYYEGILDRSSKLRFYYARILRDNVFLAEYFPLKRISDNTYHIYDRISKSFPTVIGDPLEE